MKIFAAFALALAAPALSACGFTPLYATDGPTSVRGALSQINVADLQGPQNANRHFYAAFSESLPEAMNVNGRYQLTIELTEQHRAVAVTASANTRRFDYYLFGNYLLKDSVTGQKRKKRLDAIVSYGVVESQYASLIGREDAERRAAEELARKMELDIALYLKGRAPKSETVPLPDVFNEELIEGGLPEERATGAE